MILRVTNYYKGKKMETFGFSLMVENEVIIYS